VPKSGSQLLQILKSQKMQNNINLMLHSRSRMASIIGCSLGYLYLLHRARKSDNELFRMSAAGSLMTNIVECAFYPLDTLNS